MPTLFQDLTSRFETAVAAVAPGSETAVAANISPAKDPRFGDYQCNIAMSLAKTLGEKPRDVAARIVEAVDLTGLCDEPQIAGPGFINIRISGEGLSSRVTAMENDRLGVPALSGSSRVVIDFSSPNIAKEMHVGHLRSTIIGDAIARVLDFLGHDVVRLNHLGDWGTQFGMLISHLLEVFPRALDNPDAVRIGDLGAFYQQSKQRFDEDPDFKERARRRVVQLQSGDEETLRGWNILCDASRREFEKIYGLLDVTITERGESFYNPFLSRVVDDLADKGLLQESDGAQVVFVDGFANRDGDPLPLIVKKRDGGFNYATTDLAAIRHRVGEEKANWIVYVTDQGQAQHFAHVFAVARAAGWLPDTVRIDHVGFGLVQREIEGPNGTLKREKFKTREGEVVKLETLLDEAIERAGAVAKEKNPDLPGEEIDEIARVLGLGAVKYADLSQNRKQDYVFSFDKMLDLKGNTAPYMIYAYVRVRSIGRKGGVDFDTLDRSGPIGVTVPEERALALTLARFSDAVLETADSLMPNVLTAYLYDLAGAYSRFFKQCPVLHADSGEVRNARLRLCDLTARTIRTGLGLLGIGVLERM